MIASLPLFAQKDISVFEVAYAKAEKITGTKFDDYFFIKTEAQSSAYFYMISPLGNMVDSFKTLGDIVLLGSTFNGDEIRFYFTWNGKNGIHSVSFSKERKKFEHYKKITDDLHYVGVAYKEKNFFVLTFDKKDEKLQVSKVAGDSLFLMNEFAIEDKDLVKYFKKKKFSFISDEQETSLDSATNQNKVYFQNGNIILISDSWESKEVAETKIIALNLAENLIAIENLVLPYDNKTEHNSFLFKDKLYVLGIDRIILGLNIYDFPSLEKVSEHRYLKGVPVAFKASDLIDDDKNWDKEWQGKWSDKAIAEEILRRLNKGVPVIIVSKADSVNNRLLIGRCVLPEIITVSSQSMPLTPGGATIATTTGAGIFGPKTTPPEKAHFYGYLNNKDYSVPSALNYKEHGSFNRASRRLNKISKDTAIGGSSVISSLDGGYLIYLNKKSRNVVLEKL